MHRHIRQKLQFTQNNGEIYSKRGSNPHIHDFAYVNIQKTRHFDSVFNTFVEN